MSEQVPGSTHQVMDQPFATFSSKATVKVVELILTKNRMRNHKKPFVFKDYLAINAPANGF